MHISVADESIKQTAAAGGRYVLLPFYKNGIPCTDVSAPRWGMTLRAAGSMRFRWNETNSRRLQFLAELAGRSTEKHAVPVQLELIHSKTVYYVDFFSDTFGLSGDGIITRNRNLLPIMTVADCMPLFFYDPVSGIFGAVHSGWKGTGIAEAAVKLARQRCGAEPENICAVIGPHIRNCCYIVNEERAQYFRRNFTESCVVPLKEGEAPCRGVPSISGWNNRGGKLYRLSLEDANCAVLAAAGIRDENITSADDCTCCCSTFGSFRRETSGAPENTAPFTVQAAFCGYLSF